jgi:putative restriction endonuclease
LDAAHIIPDNEPGGDPTVKNGIAMCKLHHAAFDKLFLGIRPDYTIVVRKDVLIETDGPMLRHGLQSLHNMRLSLPKRLDQRPDPDLLAQRLDVFRLAG